MKWHTGQYTDISKIMDSLQFVFDSKNRKHSVCLTPDGLIHIVRGAKDPKKFDTYIISDSPYLHGIGGVIIKPSSGHLTIFWPYKTGEIGFWAKPEDFPDPDDEGD